MTRSISKVEWPEISHDGIFFKPCILKNFQGPLNFHMMTIYCIFKTEGRCESKKNENWTIGNGSDTYLHVGWENDKHQEIKRILSLTVGISVTSVVM